MSWVSSPPKLVDARLFLKFDFISLIPDGYNISTPTQTASLYTGPDDSDALVIETAEVVQLDTCFYVPVSGGSAGSVYEVVCTAEIYQGDDPAPQVRSLHTLVAVLSSNPDAQPE